MKKREQEKLELKQLQEAYLNLKKVELEGKFVFFEDIESVPFFHKAYEVKAPMMSLCVSGEATGRYDMETIHLKEHDIVVVLSGHKVAFQNASNDFHVLTLMLNNSYVTSMRHAFPLQGQLRFHRDPKISLDSDSFFMLWQCLELLKSIMRTPVNNKYEVTATLFNLITNFLWGLQQASKSQDRKLTHEEQICERFLQSVKVFYRESRKINWYAAQLDISPKHLANTVKHVTGVSAHKWINEEVLLHAKQLLKSPEMKTVQSVSDYLGFVDLPTFTKFFKTYTGETPSAYREK